MPGPFKVTTILFSFLIAGESFALTCGQITDPLLKMVTLGRYRPRLALGEIKNLPEMIEKSFEPGSPTRLERKRSELRGWIRDWLMYLNDNREPVVATRASLDGLALARWGRNKPLPEGFNIQEISKLYEQTFKDAAHYPLMKMSFVAQARSLRSYVLAVENAIARAERTDGFEPRIHMDIEVRWTEYTVRERSGQFSLVESEGVATSSNILNLKLDLRAALEEALRMNENAARESNLQADRLKVLETILRRHRDAEQEFQTEQARQRALEQPDASEKPSGESVSEVNREENLEVGPSLAAARVTRAIPAGKGPVDRPTATGFEDREAYAKLITDIEKLYENDPPSRPVSGDRLPQFKRDLLPASWDAQKNKMLWEELIHFITETRERAHMTKDQLKAYVELAKTATPEELQQIGAKNLHRVIVWYKPWTYAWTKLGKGLIASLGTGGATGVAMAIRQVLLFSINGDPQDERLDWKRDCAEKFGTVDFKECVMAKLKQLYPGEFGKAEEALDQILDQNLRFRNPNLQKDIEDLKVKVRAYLAQKKNSEVASEAIEFQIEELSQLEDRERRELLAAPEDQFLMVMAPYLERTFGLHQLKLQIPLEEQRTLEVILKLKSTGAGFPKEVGQLLETILVTQNEHVQKELLDLLRDIVVESNVESVEKLQDLLEERRNNLSPSKGPQQQSTPVQD